METISRSEVNADVSRAVDKESKAVGVDLSVIIPAIAEGPNLEILLPALKEILIEITDSHEIIIVTRENDDHTARAATASGAVVLEQSERGYGGALLCGFGAARGDYILTMDADLSHPPTFVRDLYFARRNAEVVIASRYVEGGRASMPLSRYILSRVLNSFFSRGLSLSARDLSSGFRIYRRDILPTIEVEARDFDSLQEILVKASAEGWKIGEIPFTYEPRRHGSSHARVFQFGMAYLRTFWKLWKLRNSILAADYDDRAHDSVIPLQRYWQRKRFKHVTELIGGKGPVLDVGCGSSRIIGALPPGSVALDVLARKLRYDRKFIQDRVRGSIFQLPFADASFPTVLSSQVIEHIPKEPVVLDELCRVLKPGGRLVLGTPDYSRWEWVVTEKLYGFFSPGGYADEHIAHYSRNELIREMSGRGFKLEEVRYILRGELILAFRKGSG
jgi:dolichol-phosphate mannosyltransferase